jgi:hypothetical protein
MGVRLQDELLRKLNVNSLHEENHISSLTFAFLQLSHTLPRSWLFTLHEEVVALVAFVGLMTGLSVSGCAVVVGPGVGFVGAGAVVGFTVDVAVLPATALATDVAFGVEDEVDERASSADESKAAIFDARDVGCGRVDCCHGDALVERSAPRKLEQC